MTVRLDDDGAIVLEGSCPIEDVEALSSLMLSYPDAPLVWDRCEFAHTSIVQLLMAARPIIRGAPKSPFLARWIAAELQEPAATSATSPGGR